MSLPQLIPVLDLMQGQVVHGIAGNRDSYRPILSQLTASSEPVTVAKAIRERFGLHEFYVADLDAIRDSPPQWKLIEQLVESGFSLSVDAAASDDHRAVELFKRGVTHVIVGLESLQTLDTVSGLICKFGHDRVIFSLDLKQGQPLGPATRGHTSIEIATALLAEGLQRILLLDLAAVGRGTGIPTLQLCQQILQAHPAAILWTGGGVRGQDDLRQAADAGVQGVLVASALHDGRISPT